MPLTVVISCPSACTANTVHDLTDSPSIWTVQAPQLVVLHPGCTPPIPRFSLRWWSKSSLGSTSATWAFPSTVIWILRNPLSFPQIGLSALATRPKSTFYSSPQAAVNALTSAAFFLYIRRFCSLSPFCSKECGQSSTAAFFVHFARARAAYLPATVVVRNRNL